MFSVANLVAGPAEVWFYHNFVYCQLKISTNE
jgi:hypothetical protein